MAHFSLSWDAYKNNICKGLSALQQNGEFVDMTLAADGHHVKVHQLVMSLASPYIKDIITSTQCQHPVIFLNKMSYATLCAILEYIYTGEVLVTKENLNQIFQAAQELRIKGLEDMKTLDISASDPFSHSAQALVASHKQGQPLDSSFQYKDPDPKEFRYTRSKEKKKDTKDDTANKVEATDDDFTYEDSYMDDAANDTYESIETDKPAPNVTSVSVVEMPKDGDPRCQLQYTLSNQGSLQMILNRYVYNLRYTSRRDRSQRQWRCIDLRDHKCQAAVITKGETVVTRVAAHNHPFHDHKILKKVRDRAVFTAIREAEAISVSKKLEREKSLAGPTVSDESV